MPVVARLGDRTGQAGNDGISSLPDWIAPSWARGVDASLRRDSMPAFRAVATHPLTAHPLVESVDFRRLFIGDVLVKVGERYFALTFAWWLLAGPHADKSRLGLLLRSSAGIVQRTFMVSARCFRARCCNVIAVGTNTGSPGADVLYQAN